MTTTASSTPDPDRKPHPAAAYHERRRSQVDEKILKTARAVLDDGGMHKFTVERVAGDSGVAKTTIYRRFKNSAELAKAAVDHQVAAAGADIDAAAIARELRLTAGDAIADALGVTDPPRAIVDAVLALAGRPELINQEA